jgi:hypothetical protein
MSRIHESQVRQCEVPEGLKIFLFDSAGYAKFERYNLRIVLEIWHALKRIQIESTIHFRIDWKVRAIRVIMQVSRGLPCDSTRINYDSNHQPELGKQS